jgi:hypothetical protein
LPVISRKEKMSVIGEERRKQEEEGSGRVKTRDERRMERR